MWVLNRTYAHIKYVFIQTVHGLKHQTKSYTNKYHHFSPFPVQCFYFHGMVIANLQPLFLFWPPTKNQSHIHKTSGWWSERECLGDIFWFHGTSKEVYHIRHPEWIAQFPRSILLKSTQSNRSWFLSTIQGTLIKCFIKNIRKASLDWSSHPYTKTAPRVISTNRMKSYQKR